MACRSVASGVVRAPDSVPMIAHGARPDASSTGQSRWVTVVLPDVPVTPTTTRSCDGLPQKAADSGPIALRTLGTMTCGTASGNTWSTTSATAPAATAAPASSCPSPPAPRTANQWAPPRPPAPRRDGGAGELMPVHPRAPDTKEQRPRAHATRGVHDGEHIRVGVGAAAPRGGGGGDQLPEQHGVVPSRLAVAGGNGRCGGRRRLSRRRRRRRRRSRRRRRRDRARGGRRGGRGRRGRWRQGGLGPHLRLLQRRQRADRPGGRGRRDPHGPKRLAADAGEGGGGDGAGGGRRGGRAGERGCKTL